MGIHRSQNTLKSIPKDSATREMFPITLLVKVGCPAYGRNVWVYKGIQRGVTILIAL